MLDELDWLVIPGGPGLSSKYLELGLSKPFAGRKLHFYNPPGSPEQGVEVVPTIEDHASFAKAVKKVNSVLYLR